MNETQSAEIFTGVLAVIHYLASAVVCLCHAIRAHFPDSFPGCALPTMPYVANARCCRAVCCDDCKRDVLLRHFAQVCFRLAVTIAVELSTRTVAFAIRRIVRSAQFWPCITSSTRLVRTSMLRQAVKLPVRKYLLLSTSLRSDATFHFSDSFMHGGRKKPLTGKNCNGSLQGNTGTRVG